MTKEVNLSKDLVHIGKDLTKTCEDIVVLGKDTFTVCSEMIDNCLTSVQNWFIEENNNA